MKCDYGCNKEGKFEMKNHKWCCSKSPNSCEGLKSKQKNGIKKKMESGWNPGYNFYNENEIWNKGLTAKNDKRVLKGKETLKQKYKDGTIIPSFLGKHHSNEAKQKMSSKKILFCKNIEERERLRDIGRKGGFGKKGYTSNGVRYESLLEKEIFEYLEKQNINFIPHKHIPNSSKVSDIYLPDKDLWIEIDGINREKRKKWLGKDYEYWLEKLNIYNKENLNYKIIYNLNEFKMIL